MKKIAILFVAALCCHGYLSATADPTPRKAPDKSKEDSLEHVALEPWSYSENFEHRDLGAWASYPLWQDIAYDQNFRVNELVPGDANLSLVQKATPYTPVDNYVGAQKLLDMYLVPGAELSFRYYLKTNQSAESYTVRFAAGDYGKVDVIVPHPQTNQWTWVKMGFDDFVRANPALAGKDRVKIFALAFLAKIPNADPAMPIYLGLDDISFKSARATAFRFAQPEMFKLPEYPEYIPRKHYSRGDPFLLRGQWPVDAERVTMDLAPFTGEGAPVYQGRLSRRGNLWVLPALKLSFPEGLYRGKLVAYRGTHRLSTTEFTVHIAPQHIGGQHPRLLFDAAEKKKIDQRFQEERFQTVYADIKKNARLQREKNPVTSLVFDLDQFPDEDWLPTWAAWGSHIYNTSEALRANAMAYAFHGDREAGNYAKNVLVTLSKWPNWTHPWQTKRGRFSEHRTGSWAHRVAEAYDLTYDLMTPDERTLIRKAVMKNIIEGVHRTYVDDDNITAKTSNWIGHTVGGSLMNMAAMFGDGPETENLEPYFTGAMIKFYAYLDRVTDSKDGAWGEGYGYNNYTFSNLAYSVPALKNVFNIDVSAPLVGTYNEYIWGGLIKNKEWFEYGDSGGDMGPATNWAFLLHMRKEPRLAWFYNYLKQGETYQDVLYNTHEVKEDAPFDENPVKVFREIGTTVFKSGWESKDFSFVMRSGPFFNHQHLDQGSFWLADHGVVFMEERHLHNSDYYDDPLYQSHLIQPVAHSTILVDGNQQSQRTGDHLTFAPGFDDHAFIDHFLDGKEAAFSTGDIGRLYWDKVKSLKRQVLYLKPRTVLMLDEAVPEGKDASVTLLYQTAHLDDIQAGQKLSTITREGVTLNVHHLTAGGTTSQSVETPHYLKTLLSVKPLQKEGMLTVTARTSGQPLVMANLLTTNPAAEVSTTQGEGFVQGIASGKNFAFSTTPGNVYRLTDFQTDAHAFTWNDKGYFVALATVFRQNGVLVVSSEAPVTFEYEPGHLKYYRSEEGTLTVGVVEKPAQVLLNGKPVKSLSYDESRKTVTMMVPAGEGWLQF